MQLEEEYSLKTAITHRKKFAQFFTPQAIASLMTDWLLGSLTLKTVLEPAFGLGVFTRNLIEKKDGLTITGYELDKVILNEGANYFDSYEQVLVNHGDYIFSDWQQKYDGIICNPPYLKFHNYDNKKMLERVEEELNFKFSGSTNLYSLFLLKSIVQLNQNGRAAYIVPSEFLNSDYGKHVKDYLLQSNMLRHIFVIDFKENVFGDALTTSSILLLANDAHGSKINITNIESKHDLQLIDNYIKGYPNIAGEFSFATHKMDAGIKWRKYYHLQHSEKFKNLVPFSNYAKVVRGIATGANDYFTFSRSKAEKYSIPASQLLPCICRSKDVKGSFFSNSDFDELIEKDELTYLFNGLGSNVDQVSKYIELGEFKGVHKKYLTKNRKPWYTLENRPPAPIWVSVFNRNGIRFIRNEANISNLTTFHCVYIKSNDLLNQVSADLLFAYLLTDVAQDIFNDNRREYGNGLKKFEPNDLNKANILDLSQLTKPQVDDIITHYVNYKSTGERRYIDKIDTILRDEFLLTNDD